MLCLSHIANLVRDWINETVNRDHFFLGLGSFALRLAAAVFFSDFMRPRIAAALEALDFIGKEDL